jgi:hypothetical protein
MNFNFLYFEKIINITELCCELIKGSNERACYDEHTQNVRIRIQVEQQHNVLARSGFNNLEEN